MKPRLLLARLCDLYHCSWKANHLELTPPRSFAGRGTGAAVRPNLLRVGLPIAAAPVQVPTVRQNAPVVLTKRHHTIANADRLLLPPCPRPLRKPGVNGCTLFVFLIVFLPCFLSALIAFSFFSMFLDLESSNYFLSCVT